MTVFEKLSKKWAKEILVKLDSGPRGFQELMNALTTEKPMVSSRTLSDRLVELEKAGLVKREVIMGRPPRSRYSITGKGKRALSLIGEIDRL
jgi:DNA-binding HxlR family transcriptional regulator